MHICTMTDLSKRKFEGRFSFSVFIFPFQIPQTIIDHVFVFLSCAYFSHFLRHFAYLFTFYGFSWWILSFFSFSIFLVFFSIFQRRALIPSHSVDATKIIEKKRIDTERRYNYNIRIPYFQPSSFGWVFTFDPSDASIAETLSSFSGYVWRARSLVPFHRGKTRLIQYAPRLRLFWTEYHPDSEHR